MALVVQTGRALTITIDGDDYSIQTAEVTLVPSMTVDNYITLTGKAAIAQPVTWELNVRAFQDWGEATSFCDNMTAAAAIGTPIAFTMDLPGGGTASGNVVPMYVTAGGAADSALEVDVTFTVDGDVTFA